MKKVLTILAAFAVAMLVACGPSAEEQKKMEEALQKAADSAANALLEQASTAAADTSKPAEAPADSTKQ